MPPDPFFSGPGLDRADHLRADPGRIAELARDQAALEMVWFDGQPMLDNDGQLCWQAVTDPALFLGLEDGSPRFSPAPASAPAVAYGMLGQLHPGDAPLFAAALSLATWHVRHGFCPACGHPSEAVRGGWSRRCQPCNLEQFPRVDPVVIMLAEHDGHLLLGRQPHYPPNRFSALAGFIEPGETIEAAVAREIKEEAGVEVTDVRYLASQPWPFPNSLMIGCWARALNDRLTIDFTELDDARWFSREEVIAALAGEPEAAFLPPPPFAIARTLLEHWLAA